MTTTGIAIGLDDVRRTYDLAEPVHALDGVTFDLARGSYTAIMGPSGSGKSTLMNVMGCLDTPTAGTVVVDGRDVQALDERERTRIRGAKIGFVFQTFNLMPRLTALENVALPQLFQGVKRAERESRARTLLERVGLADRADHRPNELSGGQRQRVALARALVNDPAIVLADEPSGNLDTASEAVILDLLDEFQTDGTTMVVVSHERQVAERADRIIHLLDGRIERIEEVDGDGGRDSGGGRGGRDHRDGGSDRASDSERGGRDHRDGGGSGRASDGERGGERWTAGDDG